MTASGPAAGEQTPPAAGAGRRGGLIGALADHYRSVDSAPKGLSVALPASTVNGFLVTFWGIAVAMLTGFVLIGNLGVFDGSRDLIFASQQPGPARVPIRLFFLAFFATYGLYAYTNWLRRFALMGALIGKFLLLCLAVDLLAVLAERVDLTVPLFAQQLATGLCAMAVFPHTVLRHARLPPCRPASVRRRIPVGALSLLLAVAAVSIALAVVVENAFLDQVTFFRELALIGGIGPGVFLVQQFFAFSFFAIGTLANARSRRAAFAPDVGVLIPAHNEAHSIGDTIRAVDRAAATYDGGVHLYVVDNCSADDTTEVAQRALDACELATGEVLACDIPGKAIALNHGLARIREDFVVRIDADTVIGPGCLAVAMRHFADPDTGSVGGLPFPTKTATVIDRVRLVEVLLRHGFFQVAQGGFGGIIGVPGMFAVYRRSAIEEIGGTTEGMNGEDTDIVLRIHAAGYRTVSDPKARYYSETPEDYPHLREQRTRWFRSIYHVSAHNRNLLFNPRMTAGAVVLPFMLASAARRAMLAPLILYCATVFLLYGNVFARLPWQPVAAMVLGLPLVMAILVLLGWRQPRALLYLPAYLGFRVLRSYFTIGSALSLVYPPLRLRRHISAAGPSAP